MRQMIGFGPRQAWMSCAMLIGVCAALFTAKELTPGALAAGSRLHGAWGAFLAGLLAGIFSAHCAAPVIVALLAIVIERGQILFGIILLLFFSVGHGILSVVAGTSVGLVQKITASAKYERASRIIKIALGVIIMLVALWLLWEAFSEGVLGIEHEHHAIDLIERNFKWL